MSFNQYYQDELAYLREMGEVFANAYPKLAPFLAQKGQDPDVERLLEGFAFIAGKIHQKLDDQLPEVTHGLHALLWPHLLRPIPSLSILQMTPEPDNISERKTIERGAEITSTPVDGTNCRFRTCYDVDLTPFTMDKVQLEDMGAVSKLDISLLSTAGVSLKEMNVDSLRFFLYGDMQTSFMLYLYIFRYLKRVVIKLENESGVTEVEIDPSSITKVGFALNEELVPYPDNAFIGYRLLQEYYSLPHKFLFFDVNNLGKLPDISSVDRMTIQLEFSRKMDHQIRINDSSVLLYCTPVVNLFPMEADPIRLNHEKGEYLLRPSSEQVSHYEVYSIEDVTALVYGGRERTTYRPFVSFDNTINVDRENAHYYQHRIKPAVTDGVDNYMSFITPKNQHNTYSQATVSVSLTCSNRDLPKKLQVGELNQPSEAIPSNIKLSNIFPPTPSTPAPIEKDLHWQLISNMSLNYLSLADVDTLKTILSTYNFQACNNRQAMRAHELKMEGIIKVELKPKTKLFKGVPIRGNEIRITAKSEKFSSEGDMYLFFTVLNEFLSLYATINSFNELLVNDVDKGEIYRWKAKLGNQLQI